MAQSLSTPQKFALVIGNGAYANLSRLSNPVNDADDMTAALQELGFTVEKVLNGGLDQMESAVSRLKNRLSASGDSYGFFFYAGHGVQSNGENYLIPVDANIPGENYLRSRAVSVQIVLDELNDARNKLNVIVLDACRDNPFGWARSGSRGLALISRQPADSIIVYATSAGQTASDGTGCNGLFTGQLLNNLRTPGLEVKEMFNRTGADVAEVSNRRQIPAVYNQFFGAAYLGEPGETAVAVRPAAPTPMPASVTEQSPTTLQAALMAIAASVTPGAATGSLEIHTVTSGTLEITGLSIHQTVEMPARSSLPIEKINVGRYHIVMRYEDGKTEEKTIEVKRSEDATLKFYHRPDARLNTLGGSVGTGILYNRAFAVTVQGTIAPGDYQFFDLGMDIGLGTWGNGINYDYIDKYSSLRLFVRYAFFQPFSNGGGWHVGLGGSFISETINSYDTWNGIAGEFATGFIFRNGITLSVNGWLEFIDKEFLGLIGGGVKLAVGYSYRFKGKEK